MDSIEPEHRPPRVVVSLATFNEADNLAPLVAEIRHHAPHVAILVIDDASPDGTGLVADRLAATLPDIHVIHRPGKLGLGTALCEAMRYAIAHGFDFLINMDADFSHPPRFLPDLLRLAPSHDVVIGSRYIAGGSTETQFTWRRRLMSRCINDYTRLLTGLRARDLSGSYRCYRVSKLAALDLSRIRARGYGFMEEILAWCSWAGCRITETPIRFEDRRHGESKINAREAVEAVVVLGWLGLKHHLGLLPTTPTPPPNPSATPPRPRSVPSAPALPTLRGESSTPAAS